MYVLWFTFRFIRILHFSFLIFEIWTLIAIIEFHLKKNEKCIMYYNILWITKCPKFYEVWSLFESVTCYYYNHNKNIFIFLIPCKLLIRLLFLNFILPNIHGNDFQEIFVEPQDVLRISKTIIFKLTFEYFKFDRQEEWP